MVVDYLYVACISVLPSETEPVLIINANAILTLAVSLKRLESVARRDPEISKLLCAMQIEQLTPHNTLNRSKTRNITVIK